MCDLLVDIRHQRFKKSQEQPFVDVFLKVLQFLQESTCVGVSFCLFSMLEFLKACNFIKKRLLTQMFFCEYCEIFQNRNFCLEMFLKYFDLVYPVTKSLLDLN